MHTYISCNYIRYIYRLYIYLYVYHIFVVAFSFQKTTLFCSLPYPRTWNDAWTQKELCKYLLNKPTNRSPSLHSHVPSRPSSVIGETHFLKHRVDHILRRTQMLPRLLVTHRVSPMCCHGDHRVPGPSPPLLQPPFHADLQFPRPHRSNTPPWAMTVGSPNVEAMFFPYSVPSRETFSRPTMALLPLIAGRTLKIHPLCPRRPPSSPSA